MTSKGEKRIYFVLYSHKGGLHIREICRKTKLTLPTVLKHINKGEKEKRIIKTKVGQLIICKLNFSEQNLIPIMKEIELDGYNNFPHAVTETINSFLEEIPERPLIVLIFGSYASRTYSSTSDLDILLVFQMINHSLIEKIENTAKRIKGRTGVNIQPISFAYKEFKQKILDKENEFMKDIRKDVLIIQGFEEFFSLLGRFYS